VPQARRGVQAASGTRDVGRERPNLEQVFEADEGKVCRIGFDAREVAEAAVLKLELADTLDALPRHAPRAESKAPMVAANAPTASPCSRALASTQLESDVFRLNRLG